MAIFWNDTYLLFANCPRHRLRIAKAHASEDRDGYSQATVAKSSILALRILERGFQTDWDL
jgi:hypothetical protein